MTDDDFDDLRVLVGELLQELRHARRGTLVVRIPDTQIDEISHRVLERLDERLAPREVATDTPPARPPERRGRFGL